MPRVARLLALAHRIDQAILAGEIRDWAHAARLVGVTRARMTQIANLLLLTPDLQEGILTLPPVLKGRDPVIERHLRSLLTNADWLEQRRALASFYDSPGRSARAKAQGPYGPFAAKRD